MKNPDRDAMFKDESYPEIAVRIVMILIIYAVFFYAIYYFNR